MLAGDHPDIATINLLLVASDLLSNKTKMHGKIGALRCE